MTWIAFSETYVGEKLYPDFFIRSSTLFEKAYLRRKIFLTILKRLFLLLESGFSTSAFSPRSWILKEPKWKCFLNCAASDKNGCISGWMEKYVRNEGSRNCSLSDLLPVHLRQGSNKKVFHRDYIYIWSARDEAIFVYIKTITVSTL